MRLTILTVGRLARSPETELVKLYTDRATAGGRALGLGPVEVIEVEAKKPGKVAEALVLIPHFANAHVVACDEQGTARSSREFAAEIAKLRDDGQRRLVLVIGGADGLDASVLSAAHSRLAFGPQTWPHALVRVMLAEQIYRAVTLLAGGPYHRD